MTTRSLATFGGIAALIATAAGAPGRSRWGGPVRCRKRSNGNVAPNHEGRSVDGDFGLPRGMRSCPILDGRRLWLIGVSAVLRPRRVVSDAIGYQP
jgi:hypothetical protein